MSKHIGDKVLFEHITEIIQNGQQIGIVGPNGAGKTTLLNILNGDDQAFEGALKVGQTVKIAYFRQTEARLDRDIRMIDYLREESEVAKEKDGTAVSVTQLLERFYSLVQRMEKRCINYLVENKKIVSIKIIGTST